MGPKLQSARRKLMAELPVPLEFSIIIPWKSGNPLRELALANLLNNLAVQETPESREPVIFELIIVQHVVPGEQYRQIQDLVPMKLRDRSPQNHYITLSYPSAFNKSWCMNVGARQARYPHLIFMDADSLLGADFIRTIKYHIRSTPPPKNSIMFCWNYLIKLPGRDEPISRHVRPDTTMAMGGIWYAKKDFFFDRFGGMNENYAGYGGEDNDAYERAKCLMDIPAPVAIPYPLAHQYHDNEPPSGTVSLWEKARRNPGTVCERLRQAGVGKRTTPTIINMADL